MITFDTTIGTCGLRYGEAGITGVLLPRTPPLTAHVPEDCPGDVRAAAEAIAALFAGEPRDLREVVLDERRLDPFRRQVYAATREIGPGETASYGEIALAIGQPGAARAVGRALASNPFPIIVPCHRVLAADGALNGFSAPGGIATKRRMLELEGAPAFRQQPLFA
jgi:methylated-DNA-[protein]-cysteine S-methyltransferase